MTLPIVDVTIVLVAVATACAVIFIGLGFLPFPGRASAIWSGGFATIMASSYLLVTADAIDSSWLRAAANGPILCVTGLVWVGLRARRGREPIFVVPTILVFSLLTIALGVTSATEWYSTVFRLAFAAGAVFSALIASELLLRVESANRDITAPLTVASLGFVGLTVALLAEGAIMMLSGEAGMTEVELLPMRSLNELIASVYLICGVVTLLGLTRNSAARNSKNDTTSFFVIAQDRLDRAKAAGDLWWSVLDIRLDDPAELLNASSGRAFDRVTTRFADDIRSVMPPESDIHAVSPTQYLVLLPRPDTAVRAILSQLLERVATVTDQQAVPVRLSASIGVASASLADYSIECLSASAADAAEHAQVAGGDRWERAVFSS